MLVVKHRMNLRNTTAGLVAAGTIFLGVSLAFQEHVHTWREYPGVEYNTFPTPADYQEKTEWVFARLMYPPFGGFGGRYHFGRGNRFDRWDWTQGVSSWTTDYPRSDRHLNLALRRLTRIHVRSVEQPINLDDGDQYDWPWLYAVEVGHWNLTSAQVKAFREFIDRGGFFMCDDFHGTEEWEVFVASMNRIFPDRQIVDIPNDDAIFHTVYDLDDRFQVPGWQFLRSGRTYEQDGVTPRWRGIYDDKGRVVVAICHNMDLGDSWEHADDPEYPQKYSALGIRIAINYVVYGMTH
jgi:hypothetical protein